MSTYKEIVGKKIKSLSSDPSDSADGQMWYNTTTQKLRGLALLEAWVSSSNMPTATGGAGSGGTVSSSFYATGSTPSATSATFHYNGTGYSAGGNTNNQRNSIMGAGTGVPAALIFGGNPPSTTTETYNGTSWTNGPAYSTDVYAGSGNGTYTAALKCGGFLPAGSPTTSTEEWGGSSWTSGGALPTGFFANGLAGTSAAALAFGGSTNNGPTEVSTSYSYDGSSWTATNSMNTARIHLSGFGSQTAAIGCGGQTDAPSSPTETESWNGTSWSVSPATLASGGQSQAAISNVGTSTAGVVAGGYNPSISNATQEYNSSTNVITAAAWSSASASNTTRYIASGVGSTTACVVYGGVLNPGTTLRAQTEEWDGSSWTESGDLSTARFGIGQGIGTQTAALAYGGYTSTIVNDVEEYDGSSWTAGGAMPATNRIQGGFGIQTAGVSAAGQGSPGKWANVYHYDGSSWTSATAYPTAVEQMAGCGTQTAGLITGGSADTGLVSTQNEYDGSSWTAGGGLLSVLAFQNNNGTQTSCQIIGGGTPSYTTAVSTYDGTTVSTAPSIATARGYGRGTTTSGAITGAIITSGSVPGTPSSNTSEEFTAETTAANIKTFSTS